MVDAYTVTYGATDVGEALDTLGVSATKFGAVADGVTDSAAAINAALADASTVEVVLGEGVYAIGSGILIPTGKILRGQGRDRTILRALPGFQDSTTNAAVVLTAQGASGVGVYDMMIDGNKVGLGEGLGKRCEGLLIRARTFTVKRVDVMNCSGYGHWCQGNIAGGFYTAGSYEDCRSENCQVHFEQGDADGVTLTDCRSSEGDGDIANYSFLHPLTGSRNITYINCRGEGPGTAVEVTANIGPLDNIRFIDCHYRTTNSATCFVVTAGQLATTNLSIIGSSFRSEGGVAALFNNTQGMMTQSQFRGAGNAITANGSDLQAVGCLASAVSPSGGSNAAVAISAPGSQQIRWLGGTIEADGPPGLEVPVAGGVIVSGDTLLIPASTSTVTSFSGRVVAGANIEAGKGFKARGIAFDGVASGASLEIGYETAKGGYLSSIDRSGSGTTMPTMVYGSFKIGAGASNVLSAAFDSTGLNLESGDVYKIAGTQVIGPRGAAVANATDAASAITQLNMVLARLRAHGLIAP